MLVIGCDVAQRAVAVARPEPRQAGVDRDRLQADIADHHARARRAHHGRRDKQAVLRPELPHPFVGAVVSVHEEIGARLDLGVDTAADVELCCAGAPACHDRTGDAAQVQVPDIGVRDLGSPLRCLPALHPDGDMLGGALVCLEAAELQCREVGDGIDQGAQRVVAGNAAAAMAHIDLRKHRHPHARGGGGGPHRPHLPHVIDADAKRYMPGQVDRHGYLVGAGELVADVDAADAGRRERIRFAQLLAADPHGTFGHLGLGDGD
ncbi:hypothetical protein D3C72_1499150 [compost metagenome]